MINDKLNTLVVLAREKKYTKTAEILNISQPAVTQHIKALEDYYQIKIFDKKGRDLILTTEGKVLVKNAKRLIALNHNIEKELVSDFTEFKRLDIGITLTAGSYFIPEILNVLKEEFPEIRYNFHTDITENIYERLKYYELDFAIIDGNPHNDEFVSKLLLKDKLIVIAPNHHPLKDKKGIDFSELKNEKFILRHEKAHTRKVFENYLSSQIENVDELDVILEIDNTALIKQLIIEGHGISVMSKAVCEANLRAGTFVELDINDFNIERGIYLIYRKEKKDDLVIQNILKLAR
ncbi:MAG: LysR family transcriptional regulator [Acholeplasmataceae bacterium]|nr:LysR family transcriptional regulator [Acholeplasmataceae bacterium]